MSRKLPNHIIRRYFSRSNYVKLSSAINNVSHPKPSSEPNYPNRILSGIQPTGSLHLGNYLGAIAQWVKLQNTKDNEIVLFIADLHSMTVPFKPKQLTNNILELTATLLACGIDPQKTVLFQQSAVKEHTELCWYLSCISTMARLSHLPQFKEKSAMLKDVPLGLFVYPVLQAADILAYRASQVPVGEDQVQHIQLVQELAKMFNNRYGHTFPMPRSLILDSSFNRVKSLRDPTKKMSKSDANPKSRICLTDHPDEIIKNIRKSITDFTSEVTYNPAERPGVSNLISIHSFVSNKTIAQIVDEAKNLNTGQYKSVVADAVVEFISPIQDSINQHLRNESYLIEVLHEGGKNASSIARETLIDVRGKLGIHLQEENLDVFKSKLNVLNKS